MSRRPNTESPLERELHENFTRRVLAKTPVLGIPGRRDYRIDPHHVIPRQLLGLDGRFVDLDEEERLRIQWDPDNGVPVERPLHDDVTVKAKRIKAIQLRPENKEFAHRLDICDLLTREVPDYSCPECPVGGGQ